VDRSEDDVLSRIGTGICLLVVVGGKERTDQPAHEEPVVEEGTKDSGMPAEMRMLERVRAAPNGQTVGGSTVDRGS